MSYRDDRQSLGEVVTDLLDNMSKFNMIVSIRVGSNEWNEEHINTLNELRKKFNDLEVDLHKLKKDTW